MALFLSLCGNFAYAIETLGLEGYQRFQTCRVTPHVRDQLSSNEKHTVDRCQIDPKGFARIIHTPVDIKHYLLP